MGHKKKNSLKQTGDTRKTQQNKHEVCKKNSYKKKHGACKKKSQGERNRNSSLKPTFKKLLTLKLTWQVQENPSLKQICSVQEKLLTKSGIGHVRETQTSLKQTCGVTYKTNSILKPMWRAYEKLAAKMSMECARETLCEKKLCSIEEIKIKIYGFVLNFSVGFKMNLEAKFCG